MIKSNYLLAGVLSSLTLNCVKIDSTDVCAKLAQYKNAIQVERDDEAKNLISFITFLGDLHGDKIKFDEIQSELEKECQCYPDCMKNFMLIFQKAYSNTEFKAELDTKWTKHDGNISKIKQHLVASEKLNIYSQVIQEYAIMQILAIIFKDNLSKIIRLEEYIEKIITRNGAQQLTDEAQKLQNKLTEMKKQLKTQCAPSSSQPQTCDEASSSSLTGESAPTQRTWLKTGLWFLALCICCIILLNIINIVIMPMPSILGFILFI